MAKYLTAKAAAHLLHVSPETLRRWEIKGQLPFNVAKTVGGHRRYDQDQIKLFAKALKTGRTRIPQKNTRPSAQNKPIYLSSSIEAIRKRPGMYVGSTGPNGLFQLVKEALDSSFTEALLHGSNQIDINISANQVVTVTDNGRGIALIDSHIASKTHPIDHLALNLGIGSSNTLHRVGICVINALSKWMILETQYNGLLMRSEYKKGVLVKAARPIRPIKNDEQGGTKLSWMFDQAIFDQTIQYSINQITDYLKTLARLCPGLICRFESPGRCELIISNNGILDYLTARRTDAIITKDIISLFDQDLELHFSWQENKNKQIISYVNYTKTEGGSHLLGFSRGLTLALNKQAHQLKLLTVKESFEPVDIEQGLLAAIRVMIDSPCFDGYSQLRLISNQIEEQLSTMVFEYFSLYLNDPVKAAEANRIISHCLSNYQKRRNR